MKVTVDEIIRALLDDSAYELIDCRKLVSDIEIHGIAHEYVPMNYADMHKVWADADGSIHDGLIALEQAIIQRANLTVKGEE